MTDPWINTVYFHDIFFPPYNRWVHHWVKATDIQDFMLPEEGWLDLYVFGGSFFPKRTSTEGWNGEMLDHFPQNLAAQKLWGNFYYLFLTLHKS